MRSEPSRFPRRRRLLKGISNVVVKPPCKLKYFPGHVPGTFFCQKMEPPTEGNSLRGNCRTFLLRGGGGTFLGRTQSHRGGILFWRSTFFGRGICQSLSDWNGLEETEIISRIMAGPGPALAQCVVAGDGRCCRAPGSRLKRKKRIKTLC